MYRRNDGTEAAGLVLDDEIHGLGPGSRVIDLLGDAGQEMDAAAARARRDPFEVLELDGIDLAPPVRPPQLRDFAAFLDHARNVSKAFAGEIASAWDEIPAFYFSNSTAVVGPYDSVAITPRCEWFDFELEVAAIVGRPGTDLHPDAAADHIAGFTIFCDWSARDVQQHEMKLMLGPSKSKDSANTLGPMLVTPDELEPFRHGNSYRLTMRGYVNDELVSQGDLAQMDWSWGEILAYASRGTTLLPGEAVGSGTVPTGCLLEQFALDGPERFRGWLQPGDVVRLDVEQLGSTRQEVLPARPVHRLPTGF
jgi:2-keto-4-pentenoate hydratase/2-oxohepta-3-ene-1,7-dioic acid hydratase in catechol pathway